MHFILFDISHVNILAGLGASLSVWVDILFPLILMIFLFLTLFDYFIHVFENTVERVPLTQVYFLSPYTKQVC